MKYGAAGLTSASATDVTAAPPPPTGAGTSSNGAAGLDGGGAAGISVAVIFTFAVLAYMYHRNYVNPSSASGESSGGAGEFDIDEVGNNHTNSNPMRSPSPSSAPATPASLGAGLGLDDEVRDLQGLNRLYLFII